MENPIPQPTPERQDIFNKRVLYEVAAIVIVFMLAVVAIMFWFKHLQDQLNLPPVGQQVIATHAKEVKSTPKHRAPVKNASVSVYESPAKIKLDLPKPVVENEAIQVVASTQVKGDDHPQTTTTTLNLETGEFETYTRRDPLPWLAWDSHGQLGIYTGIKNGEPTARLMAQQGIFQVKAVHFGAIATVDQPLQGRFDTDYYVGVGAWYRW